MKSNRLSLNYSKTSYFVNYPKRNFLNFAVDVGGHKISCKDSTKYLGVVVSDGVEYSTFEYRVLALRIFVYEYWWLTSSRNTTSTSTENNLIFRS